MKKLFSILVTSAMLASCADTNSYFGEKISPDGAIKADQVIAKLGDAGKAEMKVEGKIVSVCQKKGCWMEIELPDNKSMHITFKDYGFFVPKDASGKTAILQGYAIHDTTSVEMLKEIASDDGKSKEKIEKINTADSMIFTTEKQLKEFGDKLPADKKPAIETALTKLKEAHKSQDVAAIDSALAELNSVWQAASEEMYKTAQSSGPSAGQPGQEQPGSDQQSGGNKKSGGDEVTDVDFEEVK